MLTCLVPFDAFLRGRRCWVAAVVAGEGGDDGSITLGGAWTNSAGVIYGDRGGEAALAQSAYNGFSM